MYKLSLSQVTLLAICLFLIAPLSFAQGSKADYERAAELPDRFRGKVAEQTLKFIWVGQGEGCWYRKDLGQGRGRWFSIDPQTREEEIAFNHEQLAELLGDNLKRKIDPLRIPTDNFEVSANGLLSISTSKNGWITYDIKTGEFEAWSTSNGNGDQETRRDSTEAQCRVEIKNHNVFLIPKKKDDIEPIAVTTDGTAEDGYGGRVYWSPDSTRLVVMKRKAGDERRVTIIDSAPDDQIQPKTDSYSYLKPGDQVAIDRPVLIDIESMQQIELSNELAPNPFFIRGIRWKKDGSAFTYEYNQRGHQVYRVVEVDAETGQSRAVISEEPETFFTYSSKKFLHYLDETNELIWMSERDGWNHLYLYDWEAGKVKRQITKGQWVVREVDRVDTENRVIWFWAGGIHDAQDPYHLHYCRVNIDTGELVAVTQSDGAHTDVSVSPDGNYFVTTWSRVNHAPVHELRNAETGELIKEIARADATELFDAGWIAPERFAAKGRDGETDIYGIIIKPTNFDPDKQYPVIEQIYAGPHGAHVPKRFYGMHRNMQLAELGFIIVQIDGMGTNWRSKAFHDVAWKNLGDAGLPDRIAWMKAAAKTRPWMDLTRVGIFGGSAGGQNAMRAVLDHHDFYKAAIAHAGCHDNRMDKIWWNEQWMGWPVDDSYAKSSNVEDAHKLGGKLLLMVGELDRNVDPASTLQVVDALIKADKDFEFMLFPGEGHSADNTRYGLRLRNDFFVRHLLGVEPRWE